MDPDEIVVEAELSASGGFAQALPPRQKSQATIVVELATSLGARCFVDQLGRAWLEFEVNNHRERWPCRSAAVRAWLTGRFWATHRRALGKDGAAGALNVLEALALEEQHVTRLHNRVAGTEVVYYDLCDARWRAVKIDATGWTLVDDPPPLFQRLRHQQPQVVPVEGGDLRDLLQFVNLRSRRHEILLLVTLVAALLAEIAHAIPVLHGPQGSAKTTLLRLIRRLLDPSLVETLTIPTEPRELVQQLSHHYAPVYDNLTTLPTWVSDMLCRAVTGEGGSKRELYTDDEDVIYSYRRCVALNGINVVAIRPDLLDRCLLFGLEPIAKSKRRSEMEILKQFELARPRLLGAMFSALSRAMRIRDRVNPPELHRLADFTLWGCAIAEALGFSQQEFLEALDENFVTRNQEIIDNHPVAQSVVTLMSRIPSWSGEASILLNELREIAPKLSIDLRDREWPKSSSALSRRLNEVASNLRSAGIEVHHGRDAAGRREVQLRRKPDGLAPVVDGTDEMPSRMPSTEKGSSDGQSPLLDGMYGISPSFRVEQKKEEIENPTPNCARNAVSAVQAVIGPETRGNSQDGFATNAVKVVVNDASPHGQRCSCGGAETWSSAAGVVFCTTCEQPIVGRGA